MHQGRHEKAPLGPCLSPLALPGNDQCSIRPLRHHPRGLPLRHRGKAVRNRLKWPAVGLRTVRFQQPQMESTTLNAVPQSCWVGGGLRRTHLCLWRVLWQQQSHKGHLDLFRWRLQLEKTPLLASRGLRRRPSPEEAGQFKLSANIRGQTQYRAVEPSGGIQCRQVHRAGVLLDAGRAFFPQGQGHLERHLPDRGRLRVCRGLLPLPAND